MSHYTVTVVVPHADDAQSAVREAEAMLEPYSEHREVPTYTVPIEAAEVEHILANATEDTLARRTLEEVTADPEARAALLRVISEYMTGMEGRCHWDGENYGYDCISNPEGRWDWYQIGGRWRGFYELRDGIEDSAHMLGEPGTFGSTPDEVLTGRTDVIRKGDLDIEGMRLMRGVEADVLHGKYAEATKGLEAPRPWGHARAHAVAHALSHNHVTTPAMSQASGSAPATHSDTQSGLLAIPEDIDALSEDEASEWAWSTLQGLEEKSLFVAVSEIKAEFQRLHAAYSNHPWIKALEKAHLLPLFASPHSLFKVGQGGRDAMVRESESTTLMTHSLLTEDGWMERGRMLMFGVSDNVMSAEEWGKKFNETIDALPDDAWLVLVDAHH